MDKPVKAYKDLEFLTSPAGRPIRILSEYLEPSNRFRREKVYDTIVFYGSARIPSKSEATKSLRILKKQKASKDKIKQAEVNLEMSRYYEDTVELSCRITKWSIGQKPNNRFVVCSGGGPGIMEAANRGAKKAKGKSIGLNISLPFEQYPNPFIDNDLNFEFHYFFMRKYWFVYLAKALVIMPGGFGTFDELFEVLTLIQTGKIKKKIPIVVYDKKFWHNILNFNSFLEKALISAEDMDMFKVVDSVDEAYEFLRTELSKHYLQKPGTLLTHVKKTPRKAAEIIKSTEKKTKNKKAVVKMLS